MKKTVQRYLTKSRFKVGCECPTKLFYLDDKEYGSTNVDNSFLEALAEGGFQVGELAKIYHPNGVEITSTDKDEAAQQTSELLQQENVTIYEASFKFKNLFVKADVLVKKGNEISLIEVKAKSFDPYEENQFYNKSSLKKGKPKLNSEWEPYIIDIAFQTYVFKLSFPSFKVSSFLMLADKTAVASVDGLNQRFLLAPNSKGKTSVEVAKDTNIKTVGLPILKKICVDEEVQLVWGMSFNGNLSFDDTVSMLSKVCEKNEFVKPQVGQQCKGCEFRIGKEHKSNLKSGFENCWTIAKNLKPKDFENPFVFDIWNFRKSSSLLEDGITFMNEIQEDDVSPSSNAQELGLSSSERQWLQIQKEKSKELTPYIDVDGLRSEMKRWKFPLHFIDFETSMVAIPFYKGRRPYEQIAFQFSHHVISKDGKIAHQSEYINREKGKFPNFEFVRNLKSALENDHGTIFRYAAHENTVLCQIREQLISTEDDISDKEELIKFIETITESTGDSLKKWAGTRSMIDMRELVLKYYYHPATMGSNSIKKVLPAILNDSKYLQEKYSRPIYGNEIPSKNFKQWKWIEKDSGGLVIDPYKRLPPVFNDLELEAMDGLITEGSIADGGAAMTAYARMQFTEMSEAECERVCKALLQYCELDTFAMVMIYEYWRQGI